MKKRFIAILAIILMAFGGYAQEMATIYLLRPYDFGAAMGAAYGGKKYYKFHHLIDIDGHKFGAVPSMVYFKIEVEPGSHTLLGRVVQELTEDINIENYQKQQPNYSITINAIAGEKYYLSIDEKKLKIAQVDNKTYEKELKKNYPVQYAGLISFKGGYFYTQDGKLIDEKTGKIIENQTEGQEQIAQSSKTNNQKNVVKSDVDQNIPQCKSTADNTYVLIIANEEYQFVDNVNFAMHDGETFKEYCVKTLGVPERQIRFYPNASYGIISGGVDWLKYALDNFEGSKGIVYYCGHGIPDEKSGEAFIVPVDGKGTNTTTCYSLNTLYKTIAETKAANVTYFMDACFTGANKEGSMLVAARGVAREPAKATVGGNSVVFSASSSDETAMTYPEKGHGLFTYFLLKKLQETGGDVSYSELSKYINSNVKKEAFLINEKPQTPVVATSPEAQENWKEMKLK